MDSYCALSSLRWLSVNTVSHRLAFTYSSACTYTYYRQSDRYINAGRGIFISWPGYSLFIHDGTSKATSETWTQTALTANTNIYKTICYLKTSTGSGR